MSMQVRNGNDGILNDAIEDVLDENVKNSSDILKESVNCDDSNECDFNSIKVSFCHFIYLYM